MHHQKITNIALSEFKRMCAGKKIILLYPHSAYRNLFLSYFLSYAEERLLYYRIPVTVHTLAGWLTGLETEFTQTLDEFGQQLSGALPDSPPADLAQALAESLMALPGTSYILLLDEMDRVPMDDTFHVFASRLVDCLPDAYQLAINARYLTYEPWVELIEAGEVAVPGTAYRRNNLIFTPEEGERHPQLDIYAFGRGIALVNGRQIDNWDGALPRNLFFYLIDHKLVTRDEIFGIFWADLTTREATNVFHVTKRKITERISSKVMQPGSYELTQYNSGFYVPGDKIVRHYDVHDFETALEEAMMTLNEDRQAELYRQAIEIHRAPFLMSVDLPWVVERREKLRELYVDALIGMARLCKRKGQYEEALGYFVRSLKELPHREDIYREVMQSYHHLGRRQDAIEQYHLLQNYLEHTVGISPSRETRELYDQICNT